LVVIDTLGRAMDGGNVKETSDGHRVTAQVDRIIAFTGATVLLVHHKPDRGDGPMGGSVWRGDYQTRIELTRQRAGKNFGEDGDFQDGDTVKLVCRKMTGARQFKDVTIPVKLVTVKRGVTVPVLEAREAEARQVEDFDTLWAAGVRHIETPKAGKSGQ
jgi:hypothetical protein